MCITPGKLKSLSDHGGNRTRELWDTSPMLYQLSRLSKVRGSWFLEATDFCHPQARQIHRCIFAPVTSVNAHYYSVLTTPFDMVNAHYVIIDFRAKFFIKIQNQASDTSRSLPSFSSAPFLLRAVPSERLGQVYQLSYEVKSVRVGDISEQ